MSLAQTLMQIAPVAASVTVICAVIATALPPLWTNEVDWGAVRVEQGAANVPRLACGWARYCSARSQRCGDTRMIGAERFLPDD